MTIASFLMIALHAHTWQFRITSEGIPSLDLPVDDIALGQIARPHHGAVLEVLAPVGFDQLLPGLVLKARNKVRLGFENQRNIRYTNRVTIQTCR